MANQVKSPYILKYNRIPNKIKEKSILKNVIKKLPGVNYLFQATIVNIDDLKEVK